MKLVLDRKLGVMRCTFGLVIRHVVETFGCGLHHKKMAIGLPLSRFSNLWPVIDAGYHGAVLLPNPE